MANPAQHYAVIRKPLLTEKSTVLQDIRNQYAFKVHPKANKTEIAKAVEALFQVHVEKVNIIKVPGKVRRILGRPGRTAPWKKALVKLRKGETIALA
ncbi:MAG: 50S ribosomal protein L23 [Planctomycetes bacterium]|nr:50S ribosomal protein L23 [Planctomycetota bacterium]